MPYTHYRFLNNPLLVLSTQEVFRKTFVDEGGLSMNGFGLHFIDFSNTVLFHLHKVGIFEKWVTRQFCCCANITECTYTSLDGVTRH